MGGTVVVIHPASRAAFRDVPEANAGKIGSCCGRVARGAALSTEMASGRGIVKQISRTGTLCLRAFAVHVWERPEPRQGGCRGPKLDKSQLAEEPLPLFLCRVSGSRKRGLGCS